MFRDSSVQTAIEGLMKVIKQGDHQTVIAATHALAELLKAVR